MKLQIRVSGVEVLRSRLRNVGECAITGALTRRGLTQVGQLVTRAQKNLAPVRKGRIRLRQLDKRLKKGMAIGKATRLSSVQVVRRRKKTGELIKPGLIKRSIGYRVVRRGSKADAVWQVKMGMNVGKKRANNNFAPHAAFVGKATAGQERKTKAGASRGQMPSNLFIPNGTRFAAAAAISALDKAVKEDMVRAYNLSLRASRVVMQ
jgi:hypothetical protein